MKNNRIVQKRIFAFLHFFFQKQLKSFAEFVIL